MDYETVIGLEIHVELQTEEKIFCSCPTTFGAPENSQICPVCRGLPGARPVLNPQVVNFALRLCLATGCRIDPMSRFDRKFYDYPDLPKGYQITQWFQPIGREGSVRLTNQPSRVIRIREIHMEEDTARLTEDPESGGTQIDYNRCGVPLLEIVTQPELRSAEEAIDLITTLREMVLFLGISDGRMEQGSLRVDVNISVRRKGDQTLGVRTEMKNLSSLKAISRAIRHESQRQIKRLQAGKIIRPATRRWDEKRQESRALRSKEMAADYRYDPEPDLPPVHLEAARIEAIRARLPEMASVKRKRYVGQLGIRPEDASLLTSSPALSAQFEALTDQGTAPADAAGWLLGEFLQICRRQGCTPAEITLPPGHLAWIIRQVENGRITRMSGRRTLEAVMADNVDPQDYIEIHQLAIQTDQDQIQRWIDEVLRQYPGALRDYFRGRTKARVFIMGQVMRLSGGRADPALSARLLEQTLASLSDSQRQ